MSNINDLLKLAGLPAKTEVAEAAPEVTRELKAGVKSVAEAEVKEDDVEEGNEFTGAMAKAKAAGEDEFEVDGKKYKVEESDEAESSDEDLVEGDNVYHACTVAFEHAKYGQGTVIHGEHTLSESGEVTHYDAIFIKEDGSKLKVRNIPVANMINPQMVEHGHPAKKKKVKEEEQVEQVQESEGCKTCGETPCVCPHNISESPTMDTTELINLLKLSGITEENIQRKLDEWANTPEGVGEVEPTVHGTPDNYNFAQSVNLSLKRYLDAQDMKVQVTEHKAETLKALYEEFKKKK